MRPGWDPIAPAWGSPSPLGGEGAPEGTGRGTARGTTLLALVMIGWLFFTMALAAFSGAAGSDSPDPVSLDLGVTVTPASGWSPAADVWEAGPSQVAFKRAGVVVAFTADAYDGDTQALMDEQLAELDGEFESFRALPAASTSIAGGLPALRVLFDGVSGSADLEGEVVTATRGGTGVVMVAFAPFGQLRRVQDDLDSMLDSMVVP